ncbi:MAG: hypothetical protein GY865_05125 [candidate division Zixibacteria bacterium]|nr:hypothetical protein [candidate division Zixibacteria bacterium]
MKYKILLLTALLVVLGISSVSAQDKADVANLAGKLQHELNLTPDQTNEVREIISNCISNPEAGKRDGEMRKMGDRPQGGPPGGDRERGKRGGGDRPNNMRPRLDRGMLVDSQIDAILIDEQKPKYNALRMDVHQEIRVLRLKDQLSLSDAQTGKIRGILADLDDRAENYRNSESGDPRQAMTQLKELRDKTDKEIMKVLNEDQRKAYDKIRKERREGGQERRPQGREGRKGGGGRKGMGR